MGRSDGEGALTGEQFIQNDAHRPQIGTVVRIGGFRKIFRGHIGKRSAAARDRTRSESLRQTKVGQFDGSVIADENIGGLDVAVNDAPLMGVGEGVQNRKNDADSLGDGQRLSGRLAQNVGKVAPANQFHIEQNHAAFPIHRIDLHDMRMVAQALQQSRFLQNPL